MSFNDYKKYLDYTTNGEGLRYDISDYWKSLDIIEHNIKEGNPETRKIAIFELLYLSDKETFYQFIDDFYDYISNDLEVDGLQFGKIDYEKLYNSYIRAS